MNFEKFHLKGKIVKHFTRPKQRAALKKLFSLHQPPIPPDKILLNLWNKNFLREVYRNIQTFAFKVLQESSSWASGNGAVQMIFLTPNRNIFAGKFVNWESFLAVFWEHVIFDFKRVEIREMSEAFWVKLYCKMSDIFGWFLLALRYSVTNFGIKKTLMMSTGTCGLKLYSRKNIFKKWITNMRFWIFIILVQVSFFVDCFRAF